VVTEKTGLVVKIGKLNNMKKISTLFKKDVNTCRMFFKVAHSVLRLLRKILVIGSVVNLDKTQIWKTKFLPLKG